MMTNDNSFREFNKIPRLNREMIISEKIDGTNAQVYILTRDEYLNTELFPLPSSVSIPMGDFVMAAGSRNRWITPESDNHGFARWVNDHKNELILLGPGRHFGEWWGSGIQRSYGLTKGEKRFSLFNTARWNEQNVPSCVHVVPELYRGMFDTQQINVVLQRLRETGSVAAPGFMNPEGIVIYHVHAGTLFKVTLDGDQHKSLAQ